MIRQYFFKGTSLSTKVPITDYLVITHDLLLHDNKSPNLVPVVEKCVSVPKHQLPHPPCEFSCVRRLQENNNELMLHLVHENLSDIYKFLDNYFETNDVFLNRYSNIRFYRYKSLNIITFQIRFFLPNFKYMFS